jgi:cobalt-zinc-cadmium efflux system membrane fusion protein
MNRNAALIAVALAASACRPGGSPPPPAAPEAPGHAGHEERGSTKTSDLDRAVEELFADRCEHDRKTHECDECRYQVGVVRVPAKLLDEGLVKKAVVTRKRMETPVALTGEVRFDERRVTHLAPRAEGIIRAVPVSLGQRVERGQPLLEIESVSLAEGVSHYQEAEASLRLARRSFERQASLRQEQITSEKEFLQAKQELESAEIRTRAAADKLQRLGLAPAEVEALAKRDRPGSPGRLVFRSPASGTLLEMHAVAGEAVRPDQNAITIGDLSELWVWADVYEAQLSQVLAHENHGDMRAAVTLKAFPGEVFPATVDLVGSAMDEKTRTLKVRLGVKNRQGRLRPGMFANVQLFLPGNEEALAVPRAALVADEGRSFVFVHHHGDFWVRRPVEPGRASGDWVEVQKGLTGGETVVAEGCFLLKSDVLRSKMGAGCAD